MSYGLTRMISCPGVVALPLLRGDARSLLRAGVRRKCWLGRYNGLRKGRNRLVGMLCIWVCSGGLCIRFCSGGLCVRFRSGGLCIRFCSGSLCVRIRLGGLCVRFRLGGLCVRFLSRKTPTTGRPFEESSPRTSSCTSWSWSSRV